MQVKKINTSVVSSSPATEKKQNHAGFAEEFDSSLTRISRNRIMSESKSLTPKGILSEKSNLVSLGTISSSQPTVSHLSIRHPEYGQNCWEIIHSDLNRDKPFTKIHSGTEIYLDPESKEIIWGKSNPQRAEKRDTQPANFLAKANVAGNMQPHTLSNNDNSAHFSAITGRYQFSENQRFKSNEKELIDQSVCRAAAKYNLPKELIEGVIKAESDFQVRARSPKGAQGLMQLMPATAREMGVKNPFDIMENIEGGAKYLKKMLEIFGGNLIQALAAYNAGPQAVKNSKGRIPFQETRAYVQRVLSFLDNLK